MASRTTGLSWTKVDAKPQAGDGGLSVGNAKFQLRRFCSRISLRIGPPPQLWRETARVFDVRCAGAQSPGVFAHACLQLARVVHHPSAALTGGRASAEVPAAIAAPGETTVATFHAEGAQIYECKAGKRRQAGPGRSASQFATLFAGGQDRRPGIMRGPNWEHIDGSAVTAKAAGNAGRARPQSGQSPWLKLEVTGHRGKRDALGRDDSAADQTPGRRDGPVPATKPVHFTARRTRRSTCSCARDLRARSDRLIARAISLAAMLRDASPARAN